MPGKRTEDPPYPTAADNWEFGVRGGIDSSVTVNRIDDHLESIAHSLMSIRDYLREIASHFETRI